MRERIKLFAEKLREKNKIVSRQHLNFVAKNCTSQPCIIYSIQNSPVIFGFDILRSFKPGADAPPPSGIRPPANPKGTLLVLFKKSILVTDSKIFLRRLWRQYILSLRWSARKKKRDFFCQNFPKSAQKRLYDLFFFKNLPAAQKIWPKQRLFSALGELRKSIWSI